ncbi:MAG: hypothetical protein JKY37_18005 [Nannocystaceae bacterium]|nr:hypothetical protein [Nannocystaceae bacterium]
MLALVLSLVVGPPLLPPPPSIGDATTPAAEVAAAVQLSWTAPSQCPPASKVREGIANLLGDATAVAAASEVRVVAEVMAEAAAYRLNLRVETPSGQTTKTMSGARCEVLVDATALISAIAIDPSAVFEATETPPPEQPEPPAPGLAGPTEEFPVEPAPEPQSPQPRANDVVDRRPAPEPRSLTRAPLVRFGLQATGGLDLTMLPGVSGGLSIVGAVFGARWRAEVNGVALLPRTGEVQSEVGARVGLLAAGLRGCWTPTLGVVEFPLCGGAEAGAFRGEPVGELAVNRQTEREAYLGVVGSTGLAWAPRPYFALVARTELVVPVLRPGFAIGGRLAHTTPRATGRLFAGFELRFP